MLHRGHPQCGLSKRRPLTAPPSDIGGARRRLRIPRVVRVIRTFEGELWRHPGEGGWTFLTLPVDVGDELRLTRDRRGFGSVRVQATLGSTTWLTSAFPESDSGSFVLPIKAEVRSREGVGEGDFVIVTMETIA
jgi:hypothetical protein